MSSHQKGHMVVKSSALAPINNTLNSQLLIQDHLSAHYQMVDKAKAAVDSSKPTSMKVSQKLRDQRKKKAIINGNISQLSNRLNKMDVHDPCLRKDGTISGLEYEPYYKYESAPHPGGRRFDVDSDGQYYDDDGYSPRQQQWYQPPPSNPTYSGDLLEKMSDRFTQPDKPFTPRTLNIEHESCLKQTSFYNRPTSSREQRTKRRTPSPEERSRSGRGRRRTPPPRQPVPPLRIQRDTDYAEWIAVQRSRRKTPSPGSPHSMTISENEYSTNLYKSKHHTTVSDEEKKYLNFIREVTDDILRRGIYSDKALKLVFENHIMRHRLELNESIMRQKLADLREKLGLHFDS